LHLCGQGSAQISQLSHKTVRLPLQDRDTLTHISHAPVQLATVELDLAHF